MGWKSDTLAMGRGLINILMGSVGVEQPSKLVAKFWYEPVSFKNMVVFVLLLCSHFCLNKLGLRPDTVTLIESPAQRVDVPLGVVVALGGELRKVVSKVTVLDFPYAFVAVKRIVCFPALKAMVGFCWVDKVVLGPVAFFSSHK